jgi:hypothetical protein
MFLQLSFQSAPFKAITRGDKVKIMNLLDYTLVFFAWLINSALGFWVMVVSQHSMLAVLAVFYVGDSYPRAWRVRFLDQAYFAIGGLALLIFVFIIDGYLKDGMPKRDVLRRFARVTGIQLLMLFPLDLLTSLLQRSILERFSIGVMILELLGGAGLLAYSIIKDPVRQRVPSGGV